MVLEVRCRTSGRRSSCQFVRTPLPSALPGARLVFQRLPERRLPDQAAREFGQQMYTGMCAGEMSAAAAFLRLVADDSTDYERKRTCHRAPGRPQLLRRLDPWPRHVHHRR